MILLSYGIYVIFANKYWCEHRRVSISQTISNCYDKYNRRINKSKISGKSQKKKLENL